MTNSHPDLNERQNEAAFYKGGPILIAAGAGSGKTKTLTTRLANLLSQGINPEHIIAITFTNKAAKEMGDRVAKSIEGMERIANGQVQEVGALSIGSPPFAPNHLPLAINSLPFIGTFHSLGSRILRKECHNLSRTPFFTIYDNDDSGKLIRQILKKMNLSQAAKKEHGLGPAMFERKISEIKNEVMTESSIQELSRDGDEKEKLHALVYQEYENALRENNAFDFDDLIEKPVRLFQEYPLILEKYRDQFRYILVDEYQDINNAQYLFIKLLALQHQNLSVVGDDSQAIYSFRGANFRNFLNFERDWPNAKIVLLEENYRSSSNIISAASAVIANNKLQKIKQLWTQNDPGENIKITEHRNPEEEANCAVKNIASIKKENRAASIAILYRTNAQSRAIEQALIEYNIPYRIFGGVRFYDRKEIRDIVACLRYAVNPKDTVSLDRISKSFLKKPYLELKEKLPLAGNNSRPAELIAQILAITKYFETLAKNYTNALDRIQNIQELIRFGEKFTNLSFFLEQVSLTQSADVPGGQPFKSESPINLMTIHLAKGLEFDSVFLTGACEGLLPHQMSYSTDDDIEEERRLMYVAMTRAKKDLRISFYDIPSRFLSEIPAELTEFAGAKTFDDEERWIALD